MDSVNESVPAMRQIDELEYKAEILSREECSRYMDHGELYGHRDSSVRYGRVESRARHMHMMGPFDEVVCERSEDIAVVTSPARASAVALSRIQLQPEGASGIF